MLRRAISLLLSLLVLSLPCAVYADCMGPYPPSMVKAFNQNCAKDPKMLSFCGCIMDEVQKNIPLADFIEIGNSAAGINNEPRFIAAGKKCTPLMSGTPVPAKTGQSVASQPPIQPVTSSPGTAKIITTGQPR